MQDLPFREQVYVGTWTDSALVNNLLVREQINTIVAAAQVPFHLRAVYVLDPSKLDRAREIVAHWVRHEPLVDPKSYRSWRCRACNELVEGQFEVCWKCGKAKRG
jgi:hypothetical protein